MPTLLRETALITGASSGIGRSLARCFARGGYNLVLVARDKQALTSLANTLTTEFGVEATVLTADLGVGPMVDGIIAELGKRGLQIDVLVNNAGFGAHGAYAGGEASTDLRAELSMVDVQIGALLRLSKAFLPGMLARRRGGILNVASVYVFAPVAYQAVYGACKAFMFSFTQALRTELAGKGVALTLLCPGSTRTAFRHRSGVKEKHPNGSGMSSDAVAEAGYSAFKRGQLVVVPGFMNKILSWAGRTFPTRLVTAVLARINQRRGVGGH